MDLNDCGHHSFSIISPLFRYHLSKFEFYMHILFRNRIYNSRNGGCESCRNSRSRDRRKGHKRFIWDERSISGMGEKRRFKGLWKSLSKSWQLKEMLTEPPRWCSPIEKDDDVYDSASWHPAPRLARRDPRHSQAATSSPFLFKRFARIKAGDSIVRELNEGAKDGLHKNVWQWRIYLGGRTDKLATARQRSRQLNDLCKIPKSQQTITLLETTYVGEQDVSKTMIEMLF